MATSSTRRSLVRRLSLRAAVWAIMLGLTLAALAAWQFWRVSLRALDARLVIEAHALAAQIGVAEDGLDITVPIELRAALQAEQSYYGVFDANGRRLDGTAPVAPAAPETSTTPAVRTRAGYREAVAAGARGAIVVIGRPLEPVLADVQRLAASLFVASLVVIVVALPLTLWLRRQLARSLSQIDHAARNLTPGQPARVDATRVDEEFVGVARAINEAFDRLEGALARERQLTSDASHELRTPVSTLVAETEWALGRPRTIEEYRRSLEVCARQARRMRDLTESLLTLARLEAGTFAPTRDPVDLRALTEEGVADVRPLAHDRQITIDVHGQASLMADRVQLRILLSNLLSNAVRYNTPRGEVSVRVAQADDRVTIEVADTGPGLDPEHIAHVFDRFWRADASRSGRDVGTGLGLAISKAIVAGHGGTIACRARRPTGITFVVDLPAGLPDGAAR